MKNIDENDALTKYFVALLCMVAMVCISVIIHDCKSEHQAPAQQVSERQQEEVKLETLEDSVHYYEDGL